ncbi:MAG TPA: type II toxin-antitoxin system VapC family toxin [Bryobacteraceae bacterium]|jgi:tRNA(fMet)-specific endonuclease VapC|nr:type II toxin-antitoxin system VapC family toxin [Bryobacteraceae bacterium]
MNALGSVLLDTSIVVDYLRLDPGLHQKIEEVDDVYLPLVVLGELLNGAHKSNQPAKALAQVKTFYDGCIVLLPDEKTADLYGQIKAELSAAGRKIPENDLWIAAAARQQGYPLATRDRHFFLCSEPDPIGLVNCRRSVAI